MFYVLDFKSHGFTTCENFEAVEAKLKELFAAGLDKSEITIINRMADSCEMDVAQFWELRKSMSPLETKSGAFTDELLNYTHAHCNCCGEDFDITGLPIECPNCEAFYDKDKPYIEIYR